MKGLLLSCLYENLSGLLIGSLVGLVDVYLVLVLLAISAESVEMALLFTRNSNRAVPKLFR